MELLKVVIYDCVAGRIFHTHVHCGKTKITASLNAIFYPIMIPDKLFKNLPESQAYINDGELRRSMSVTSGKKRRKTKFVYIGCPMLLTQTSTHIPSHGVSSRTLASYYPLMLFKAGQPAAASSTPVAAADSCMNLRLLRVARGSSPRIRLPCQ